MGDDILAIIASELEAYGPLGMFIIAFISNLIPGFPALYLSLLASYALISRSFIESSIAIVGVGVGAGMGKLALFILSKALSSRIRGVARRRGEVLPLLKARRGSIALTIFLFAALPLPDDLLYVPLGVAGFNTIIFLASVVLGKIAMAFLVFLMGSSARGLLDITILKMGELTLVKVVALTAATLIPALLITYIIITVDWFKVYRTYAERGESEAVKVLGREVVDIITFKNYRSKLGERS